MAATASAPALANVPRNQAMAARRPSRPAAGCRSSSQAPPQPSSAPAAESAAVRAGVAAGAAASAAAPEDASARRGADHRTLRHGCP